jgi:glucokinase
MEAFRNKGRLSSLVARIPVRVVLTDDVALYGAAAVAARTLMD